MADDCGGIAGAVGCAVGSIAQGEIERFARQLTEGANDLWNGFFTSWIASGMDGIIGGATSEWFTGIAIPVQVFLLTLGLMIAGIRMALSARGDVAGDAVKKFLRAVFISVAGVTFFSVMQQGSNALAKSILESATGGNPATPVGDLTTFTSNGAMWMIFGLFAVIATGVQWIIMILRAVALTVLLPFWPIAAAGAMFDKHEGMFEKTTGWLLAFLLYSPVAAALYGYGIMLRGGRDGSEGVMMGLAVFMLAIFALPALMRLVVPLTSAMGRASAGAIGTNAVRSAVVTGVAVGSAVATLGASAGAGAAAKGSTAAARTAASTASTAGKPGATGSPGPTGSSNTAGSSSAKGSSTAGGSSAPSGSGTRSGSGRSVWDSARELGNRMPSGSRGVGDMIDE